MLSGGPAESVEVEALKVEKLVETRVSCGWGKAQSQKV